MSLIPPDKIGETVVSALVISAAVLKYFSDKSGREVEEEDKTLPEETEAEVITKRDFDTLVQQFQESNRIASLARNSFDDTLACVTIINILLQILASDKRKLLLKVAEHQIFTFLRHADFPSRTMLTATLEIAINEIDAEIDEEARKDKEA